MPAPDLAPLDQRTQPDRDHNQMCGETTCAMIATARGIPTDPNDVTQWMRDNLGGESAVSGGTSVAADQAWYHSRGLITDDSVNFPADAAYARGDHVHYLFHDDRNGDPDVSGPYHHYAAGQDHTSAGTLTANPWGGRKLTYADGQMGPAIEYCFSVSGGPGPVPAADDSTFLLLAAS